MMVHFLLLVIFLILMFSSRLLVMMVFIRFCFLEFPVSLTPELVTTKAPKISVPSLCQNSPIGLATPVHGGGAGMCC